MSLLHIEVNKDLMFFSGMSLSYVSGYKNIEHTLSHYFAICALMNYLF